MPNEKEFVTLDEAGEILGVTRATIYNYMKDLNMKTRKFGRDRRGYLSREQINLIKEYREKPWIAEEQKGGNAEKKDEAA